MYQYCLNQVSGYWNSSCLCGSSRPEGTQYEILCPSPEQHLVCWELSELEIWPQNLQEERKHFLKLFYFQIVLKRPRSRFLDYKGEEVFQGNPRILVNLNNQIGNQNKDPSKWVNTYRYEVIHAWGIYPWECHEAKRDPKTAWSHTFCPRA